MLTLVRAVVLQTVAEVVAEVEVAGVGLLVVAVVVATGAHHSAQPAGSVSPPPTLSST